MAVIISNGATNLSTASGFYGVEAYNLGLWNYTPVTIGTTKNIPVTFANAGNCQGIVLAFYSLVETTNKDIVVTLKEGSTARATVTLTANTVVNSVTNRGGTWIVAVTGGTFPYPVTTAGSTWSFDIVEGAGTTTGWYLATSNGTAPFYATWCDNAATFSDNDTVICKDVVTIDQTATFRGILGTGDTLYSTACVVCRSTTPTPANVSNLVWENPASASYTLTINGWVALGCHSGFRAGTTTVPILNANQGIIDIVAQTYGTNRGGFGSPAGMTARGFKGSFFCNGQIPSATGIATTLTADANLLQANLTVASNAGFTGGDTLIIGKQAVKGSNETKVYTVLSTTGTDTITLTGNVTGTIRKSGGPVIKINPAYGMKITAPTGVSSVSYINNPSNFELTGTLLFNTTFNLLQGSYHTGYDDTANLSQYKFEDCTGYADFAISTTLIDSHLIPQAGMSIARIYSYRTAPLTYMVANYFGTYLSGRTTIDSCVTVNKTQPGIGRFFTANTGLADGTYVTIQNCKWYNGSGFVSNININGINWIVKNNTHYGNALSDSGVTYGCQMEIGKCIRPIEISGNTYNQAAHAIYVYANTSVEAVETGSSFGNEASNTDDVIFYPGGLVDYELASPTGAVNMITTYIPYLLPGSESKFTDYNDTANDDKIYSPYGYTQRCGDGLTDTTVHTSGTGKFSWRFQPTSSTNNLSFSYTIPVGNLQNLTRSFEIWVKINSATFYAGTHEKPRFTINYDNGTTAYAEATGATDWQLLSVPITFTTTYPYITMTLSARTDATSTNAYVYWDDFTGGNLANGGMDLWGHAKPSSPAYAFLVNPTDVLSAGTTAEYGVNSMGEAIKDILTNSANAGWDLAADLGGIIKKL